MIEPELSPDTSSPHARRASVGLNSLRKFVGKKKSLRRRSATASGWVIFRYTTQAGIRLVSNLILTRLLTPEVFGLMALARVFLAGVKKMSDVGAKASVIRSDRGNDPDFMRTAWTVAALRGLAIALVSCAIAWPASRLYDEPVLFPLICTLSLTSIFGGLSTISAAALGRKLLLRRMVIIATITQVFTACITITAAWALGSVWALAIGGVTGSIFSMVIGHLALPPFRHRFQLEREALRDILGYGRWILLGTLFTFLGSKGQVAIQGLLVPVDVVGMIAIASMIAWFPAQISSKMLGSIVFPAFSEIRRNRPQDLPKALRRVRLGITFLVFPLFFVVAFFGQPIIDLLYDERYAAAGPILSLMALNSAIAMLGMPYQNLLLAEGRSNIHAVMMFSSAGLKILGMLIGFWAGGFVGMFVGVGIGASIQFLFICGVAFKRGYSTWALDFLALAILGGVYVYLLMTLNWPPELLQI